MKGESWRRSWETIKKSVWGEEGVATARNTGKVSNCPIESHKWKPLPTILPVQTYLLTKVPSAGAQNTVGLNNSPHILTFDIFMHDSGALFERLFDWNTAQETYCKSWRVFGGLLVGSAKKPDKNEHWVCFTKTWLEIFVISNNSFCRMSRFSCICIVDNYRGFTVHGLCQYAPHLKKGEQLQI